ncbi:MAG: hypothetical protein HUU02_16770 [Bacteroidetes bacterium]|nr:hypothetical protein [Bacteroidota bacterium]
MIHQDLKGIMWIGSYDGLSRYDGYTFINKSIADGLPSNHITAIAESRSVPGTMFIGTSSGGIAEYDTSVRRLLSTGNEAVLSLAVDHRGVLWCGTSDRLIRFGADADAPVDVLKGVGNVQQIRVDGDSLLWVTTKRFGLQCFLLSDDGETPVSVPAVQQFDPILIAERSGGVRWMADRNGNFICTRDTAIVRRVITNNTRYHALSIVGVDSSSFWFGTVHGIAHVRIGDAGKFTVRTYGQQNGLPEQVVLPVLLDHERNLWMRSFSKGLVILSDESVLTYPLTPAPLVMNNASAVTTADGTAWMTSSGGLFEIPDPWKNSAEHYVHPSPNESAYGFANALLYDHDGSLWVKYWHGALVQYSVKRNASQRSTLVKRSERLPGKDFPKGSYACFTIDRQGNIFYGIDEYGVIVLRARQYGRSGHDTVRGSSDIRPRVMMVDSAGTVWCGGMNGDLYQLRRNGDRWAAVRYGDTSVFSGHTIRAMAEEADGTVWVGSSAGRVALLRNDSLIRLPQHPLLRFTTIWAFAHSGDRVFIGTSKGLLVMDKRSGEVTIPNGTISGNAVYACHLMSGGRIAAVSEEGGHLFDPSMLSSPTGTPSIVISSFMVNGVEQAIGEAVELGSGQNTCSVEFLAVTYRDRHALRYSYQLRPVDAEWQRWTAQRAVTFAALAPGDYEFSVKALTLQGVQSTVAARIMFTILPPVWQRWWFIAAVLLAVGAVLTLAYRFRVERLLEVERLRSRIAMDLHDEIGSTLGGISVLSELLKNTEPRPGDRAQHMLDRIGISARQMMEAMSDIVWALNPQNDAMEQFISRIRTTAGEIFEPRGIGYTVTTPAALPGTLPMDARRHIYLIVKEALHNSAKHSHCAAAGIVFDVNGRSLMVRISDNGKGFPAAQDASGNGLRNMKARAALIGADVRITSEPGSGTVVTLHYHIT